MYIKDSEKGQSLVLWALFLVFVVFPFSALAIDLPSMWMSRRDNQKLVDEACLSGAIAEQNGENIHDAVVQSLNDNGVDPSMYTPNSGTGTDLGKGIEVGGSIRVALWGETQYWFSQMIPGMPGLEIGARAHCQEGLGGFLPLSLKEWEGPGSKILQTYVPPNDEWSGPCPLENNIVPLSDVATRTPPYCWVWGDWQILAGDGHVVNEGGVSMNGLIAPDVRCVGLGKMCTSRVYIPPVPEGAAVNKLKDYTTGYIAAGGYDGPLPYVGVYEGVHSALIAQQEGVSNNFLTQAIAARYGIGANLIVFVYRDGELHDGNKNFDYVEVIGYAVVKIVYIDANTVAVVPVYPETNEGKPSIDDDLPTTPAEIGEAGFDIYPVLLPWD